MADVTLKPDEVLEDLDLNGLKIIQSRVLYRFTSDAVKLAALTRLKSRETVADLGTGSAIIPLLLAGRTNASYIAGIEIQSELADMAQRSVDYNNLQDKIEIFNIDITGDLHPLKERLAKRLKTPGVLFDAVTANPPYFVLPTACGDGGDFTNPAFNAAANPSDLTAKYETAATMKDFVVAAAKLLKFGGSFYTVNKAARLAECINVIHGCGMEAKDITLIFPKHGMPADTFILRAVKGGHSGGLTVSVFE
ncbi:MAG: 50S ribosomal protein L11 methyltransferase [Clostridiaceae bacterium]|jgi:tRNA1(Val) A37 N6-methylase TrmN6|nr:50S ribosomal protein L11 methyltransferase [Clostridiaceae bacterium]